MSVTLTCREFVEFLDDYLAGALPPAVVAVFDAHLSCCPSCVSYAQTYQETIRVGRAALQSTEEEVPADVPEELVRAILAARLPGL